MALVLVNGSEIHLHGRLMSCANSIHRGDSRTTKRYKGIRGRKKFVESSTAEWVAVEENTEEIYALLADTNISRKTNSFSLNIAE